MFVKTVPDDLRKTKLLYLMGATWHNRCMFDLDTVEDSIADLLQKANIETYTFDYYGTGPDVTLSTIGDHNNQVIDYAVHLINEYDIEYIFGYSYGCMVARKVIQRCPSLKGCILLDPKSNISMDVEIIDNDKLKISKQGIRNALSAHDANVKPEIIEDYILNVSYKDVLVTAFYPRIFYRDNQTFFTTKEHVDELYATIPTCAFFTKNTSEEVRDLYKDFIYYPDASHWIMLEDKKLELVYKISEFIDLTEK